jgi:hypothetical protein
LQKRNPLSAIFREAVRIGRFAEGHVLEAEALAQQPLQQIETRLDAIQRLAARCQFLVSRTSAQEGPQAAALEATGQLTERTTAHGDPLSSRVQAARPRCDGG